jgi:hypothetical protein
LQNSIEADIIDKLFVLEEVLSFLGILLMLQYNTVNTDSAVFRVSVDTLHTVVTDFFRIEIAAVAFPAADTLPVIQYTLFMYGHRSGTPPFLPIIHLL